MTTVITIERTIHKQRCNLSEDPKPVIVYVDLHEQKCLISLYALIVRGVYDLDNAILYQMFFHPLRKL